MPAEQSLYAALRVIDDGEIKPKPRLATIEDYKEAAKTVAREFRRVNEELYKVKHGKDSTSRSSEAKA